VVSWSNIAPQHTGIVCCAAGTDDDDAAGVAVVVFALGINLIYISPTPPAQIFVTE
jgi:hypothetical protein